jgi:hypothetical protein
MGKTEVLAQLSDIYVLFSENCCFNLLRTLLPCIAAHLDCCTRPINMTDLVMYQN